MLATPELAARAADLDLVIRHVLAGLGHGMHAGRERGAGVEFSEYRAYAPGDEWRRVDWKLLARADRYFVREAERDSHVAVWLVLDATASMAEASQSAPRLDKLWYARLALGCMAAVAQRQGDAFGLLAVGGGAVELIPAARGPRQLQRVLAALARARAAGTMPDADRLRSALRFGRAPALVLAAGDWLDWPSALGQALLRLRALGHDVRVLGLQTAAESAGAFEDNAVFGDPEHPDRLVRFAGRDAYLAGRTAYFDQLAGAWKRADVPYALATIEQPPGPALRGWLRAAERR